MSRTVHILVEVGEAIVRLNLGNARLLRGCELFAFRFLLGKRNRQQSHRDRLNEGWSHRHGAGRGSASLPLAVNGLSSVFRTRPDRRASYLLR